MEKEAKLVWETDMPHDARTQWAMLYAEVLVRTNAVKAARRVGPRTPMHVLGYPRREPAMDLELDHGHPRASLACVYGTVEDARAGMGGGPGTPQRAVRVSPAPLILRLPVLMFVRDSDKVGWEMSTEDLDSWDATLQVCLAWVLDDGGDATRVFDHLAGTISSTHIPPCASATCAAVLMLSHLDVHPMRPRSSGS